MTRISGKHVLRTPCCNSFVSSDAYGSINLMAYEHWTDGRKVGGLMSEDGGLRVCSCSSFYLIGDCERVMTIPNSKPIAPKGWESIKSNWLTKVLGKPTKEDILLNYDTRPLHEIKAEQISIPESQHVPDSSMPEVFEQRNACMQLQIVARRRYWRYLNDPFRDAYRDHKKIDPNTFPDYQPSSEQIENMIELADNLQKSGTNLLEVSELFREMGDFSTSLNALNSYKGRKCRLQASIYFLIKNSISTPSRFTP